jgi:biopolymer transport protein ExbD
VEHARRRRGRFAPEVQVNLTSLIDVVFILLISFMVVAPALKHGLQVELAKTEGGEALNPERPVTVVITHDEDTGETKFYLDDDPIEIRRLRPRLEARREVALGRDVDLSVLIEPDGRVPTEATLQVLGIILDLGILDYAFLTEPRELD